MPYFDKRTKIKKEIATVKEVQRIIKNNEKFIYLRLETVSNISQEHKTQIQKQLEEMEIEQ